MKDSILVAKKITKKYHKNTVLEGTDISIYRGDFTVIMGNSGSGKSTLLQIISGMDKASSGEIYFKDKNIANKTEKELTKIRAKEFGFVFQKNHLVSNLTLYENIVVAGYISENETNDEIEQRAKKLIEKMNLQSAKDRFPSEVSGGEAQRTAIARAIIKKPQILFADEPTGALNKSNSQDVLNLFSTIHKEKQTVVLVTHDKEAALRGNRVLYLEDGKITGELELGEYQELNEFNTEEINNRNAVLEKWLKQKGW